MPVCKKCQLFFGSYTIVNGTKRAIGGGRKVCYDCSPFRERKSKISMTCTQCNASFYRVQSQIEKSKSGLSFCSQSCSATYHNKNSKKLIDSRRKLEATCAKCGQPNSKARKYCKDCFKEIRNDEFIQHMTVLELGIDQSKRQYQINSNIRALARKICSKRNHVKYCQYCGYDKHIEICHIKPISSFDSCATIMEINSPENILILCPNHHWEFDRGLITIEEVLVSQERLELSSSNYAQTV